PHGRGPRRGGLPRSQSVDHVSLGPAQVPGHGPEARDSGADAQRQTDHRLGLEKPFPHWTEGRMEDLKTPEIPVAAGAGKIKTPKGEQTRAQILETALELFRER